MEYIKIDDKIYSRRSFALHYHLSYNLVMKYYQQGLRDKALLKKVQSERDRRAVVINGRHFRSKREAANFYHIPSTTFYRHYMDGTLNIDDFSTHPSEDA